MSHAELSPSGAKRWRNCPPSLELSKQVPKKDSPYADEGKTAHEVAALALLMNTFNPTPENIGIYEEFFEGRYDSEMIFYAAEWRKKVLMWLTFNGDSKRLYVEHASVMTDESWGTADCVALSKNGKKLLVADYKYGKGVYVPIADNEQLQIYGAGVLNLGGPFSKVEHVDLMVYQPRIDRAFEDPVTYEESELISVVEDIYTDRRKNKDKFKAGSWCQFCPAKQICPELKKIGRQAYLKGQQVVSQELNPEEGDELAKILNEEVPNMERLISSIKARARHVIEAGGIIPGWVFAPGQSNRQWKKGVKLSTLRDLGFQGEPKLPTPPTVEKEIGKDVLAQADITVRYPTKPSLKEEKSSKRKKSHARADVKVEEIEVSEKEIEELEGLI